MMSVCDSAGAERIQGPAAGQLPVSKGSFWKGMCIDLLCRLLVI